MIKKIKRYLGLLDIVLISFYIWIILNSFIINERIISNEQIILSSNLFVLYILSRFYGHLLPIYWLYRSIVFIALIQSLIGWGQYFGWLESTHFYFPITGSFNNPTFLGCLLGLSLIIQLYYLFRAYKKRNKNMFIILLLTAIIICPMFIMSFSRASWISLILGYIFLLWRSDRNMFKILSFLLITILLCSGGWLYRMKKESAEGRILIWTVGLNMLKENLTYGRGGATFAAYYMHAQAEYFKKKPQSRYQWQAADNTFAFNEYIRIGYEYGIIGLTLCFIAIFYTLFISKANNLCKSMLLYFYTYSFFSYTGENFFLSAVLFMLLAYNTNSSVKNKYSRPILSTTILSFSICFLIAGEILFYNRPNKYNREFVLKRAKQQYLACDYKNAQVSLQESINLMPTSEILMDLGNCYYYLNEYKKAEECFSYAAYMTPAHIRPQYELFSIYIETGKSHLALILGNEILSRSYKKEGSVVMEAKYNVHKYLNSIQISKNKILNRKKLNYDKN